MRARGGNKTDSKTAKVQDYTKDDQDNKGNKKKRNGDKPGTEKQQAQPQTQSVKTRLVSVDSSSHIMASMVSSASDEDRERLLASSSDEPAAVVTAQVRRVLLLCFASTVVSLPKGCNEPLIPFHMTSYVSR